MALLFLCARQNASLLEFFYICSEHHFMPCSRLYIVVMCGKLKIDSDLVLKNRTLQKLDMRSDGFMTETACNLQFIVNVTKNYFTCIQCADQEHFKT